MSVTNFATQSYTPHAPKYRGWPPVVTAHLVIPDARFFRVDDEATNLTHFLLAIPAAAICSSTCLSICFKGCLLSLCNEECRFTA